jgi:hypothetical protein
MVPNPSSSIEAALNVGMVSDEYSVADFKSLQMLEPHSRSDLDRVPESTCDRSPDGTAHDTIQLAIAGREPSILFD